MAWPTRRRVRSTCPTRCPARPSRSSPFPANPDRRHLLRIETASAERIEPFCPHFGVCGGCAIQHWMPERYGEWKRSLVIAALEQAGLDATVDELIDAHGEGRRRATLHARRGARDILEVGFAALRAHHIIAIDRCPVLAPSLDGAIASGVGRRRSARAAKQAARHPGHRDRCRDRHGCPRLRPFVPIADDGAGKARRHSSARPPHPPRRVDRAARGADPHDRPGECGSATGRFPAGHRRRRADLGPAGSDSCRQRQDGRRSVLRHRPVRASPCRARADCGFRFRCARHRGPRASDQHDIRPQADRGRDPRPVPAPPRPAGAQAVRRGGV